MTFFDRIHVSQSGRPGGQIGTGMTCASTGRNFASSISRGVGPVHNTPFPAVIAGVFSNTKAKTSVSFVTSVERTASCNAGNAKVRAAPVMHSAVRALAYSDKKSSNNARIITARAKRSTQPRPNINVCASHGICGAAPVQRERALGPVKRKTVKLKQSAQLPC